ncbi:MAG: DUF58 domain-containing protein [Candidatus Aureabacteria bacterium]|nr:DUF58 domain-containing protein [Candidatus Auribacterota bacterium]MCK5161689.1 DUF58 domain-containing protein [Candidatus Auribacterota bacterium]
MKETFLKKEIFKKVRHIQIYTTKVVNEALSGAYKSVFKGSGAEFEEVREYVPGDDVRNIDWNVTARMGSPFVKLYVEERELTVILLVDMSRSNMFGTRVQMKNEIAAQLSAALAFSAIKNNDKVGLIIFTDKIEKYVPPKKGKKHVLRVIREILFFKPSGRKTNLTSAIDFANSVLIKKSVLFVISDFYDTGFKKPMMIASKKHDVIAVHVKDSLEYSIPRAGIVQFEDAETGEVALVNTSNLKFKEKYEEITTAGRDELYRLIRSMNIDVISIETDKSVFEPLEKFFRMRTRRSALR